uniref:Uncharacterized protein n=1 Tax=Romanomermis culicivorax TaxID=13658 RepID=A0A915JA93_ROMCU
DGTELVRHFLIEPTAKGVKLKGCNNEPVFGSLAALVYQHSITALALPLKLILPDEDPALNGAAGPSTTFDYQTQNKSYALLEQGAGECKKNLH